MLRQQEIPRKALADTVEAILGSVWLTARRSQVGCPHAAYAVTELLQQHLCRGASLGPPVGCAGEARGLPKTSREAERLEFLGDAVLQAVVSEHLFFELPEADEGTLSAARQCLASNAYLARRAAAWLRKDGEMLGVLELLTGDPGSALDFVAAHPSGGSALDDLRAAANVSEDNRAPKSLADMYEVFASHPPKCLADLYEVALGWRFLTSGGYYYIIC